MIFRGNLLKMTSVYNTPVDYYLTLENEQIHVNKLLGQNIKISFAGLINCIKCGRKTNKSFSQGFCYPCFTTAPEAEPAVVSPELDMAHLGISRDMEWAKTHSLIDHFVYLAVSSGLKVGVTRHTQIPTRWIDQGASYAIKLAKTPYRNLAGQIEVELKKHFADKTNWRNMLANIYDSQINLLEEKNRASALLSTDLRKYITEDNEISHISYPVLEYPTKVNSLNLDKNPVFEGKLMGIKGQYLIFANGIVMNIRSHGGYFVNFEA